LSPRALIWLALLALVCGCSTTATTGADPLTERPGACMGEGPMEAAEAWIAQQFKPGVARDPALKSEAWPTAQIERMWRDGDGWRVLITPGGATQAAIVLTASPKGSAYAITAAQPASADLLWPGL
jgi:hypothetical protein